MNDIVYHIKLGYGVGTMWDGRIIVSLYPLVEDRHVFIDIWKVVLDIDYAL